MSTRLITAVLLFVVASTGSAEGQADLRSYLVDQSRSSLFLVTHRAGLLSFLGHEHAIIPSEWTAAICLADPIPRSARGSVSIQTRSLVIDTDSARVLAGLGAGPSAEDLPELQAKLLDAEHLDAGAYPEILVTIDSVASSEDNRLAAIGRLSLHGVARNVEIPVEAAFQADGVSQLSGTLRIRQRDFGIEPESTAGLVKVSDEVDLHFLLVAEPTTRPCAGVGG